MKRTNFILFFCFSFSIAAISQIDRTTMLDWNVKNTDAIFEGKVLESSSFWGNNGEEIFTRHVISVSKSFKGQALETIEVITLGGVVGDVSQEWTHTVQFGVGKEGVFFCKSLTYPTASDLPFLLPYGFVEYESMGKNIVGVSNTIGVFENLYQDLYLPLKQDYQLSSVVFHPNTFEESIAQRLNQSGGFGVVMNGMAIEFDFDNLSVPNLSELEFDVMARASEDDVKLGDARILIRYSKEAFGENVVGEDNVEITTGEVLQDAELTPTFTDFDDETIRIDIPSDCIGTAALTGDFAILSQTFTKLLHVKLQVLNIFELASISMDDFNMQGNVQYFDENLQECVPFDTILIPDVVNPFLIPVITGFHPNPITAGTGDTLFIEGTMFGTTKGKVRFANADNGGSSFMTAHDADVVWTDTLIKVRMPSRDDVSASNPAGSGRFIVETAAMMRDTATGLEVIYAVRNIRRQSGNAERVHLADDPQGDGNENSIMTIRIYQNIIDSSAIGDDIIATAMCDWTTQTGVQWDLGPVIPIGNIPDTANFIRFVEVGSTILGSSTASTFITIDNCTDNQSNSVAFFSKFNILIRPDVSGLPIPGAGWFFGTTGNPTNNQMDFYSVVLHELGHAGGLRHANPDAKLMYYQLLPNATRRNITGADRDGGIDVLDTSDSILSMSNCPVAVSRGGNCLTATVEIERIGKITLFPNPVSEVLNFSLEDYIGGETKLLLINSLGQISLSTDFGFVHAGTFESQIDVGGLPPGLYHAILACGNSYSIGKIVKL